MLLLLSQMKLKTALTICFSALVLYLILLFFCYNRLVKIEEVKVVTDRDIEAAIEREANQVLSGGNVTEVEFPEIPVLVWWTPFSGDVDLQTCGSSRCYITNNRSFVGHPSTRVVFFYGTDLRVDNLPLPRGQHVEWALLHEESPKNNQVFSHNSIINLINHTATFRKGSDFPLTTQYLESIESLTEQNYLVPIKEKNRLQNEEGLAPVAYVQSGCDTPSGRDIWVEEFMKYMKVDSYGACLHNKNLPADIDGSHNMDNKKFLQLLAKYKFVIAIENAICEDYVTEKLWRPLQLGNLPIYLGAPNVENYLPKKDSAILIKNFESPAKVAAFVNELNKDDAKYAKYLSHKNPRNGGSKESVINPNLVDLLEQRRWGVTSEQQMEMGNFVKHFQCFVCDRVFTNMKYQKIGFKPKRYKATIDHYGCPSPKNPLTNQEDPYFLYTQEWYRSKFEAEVLTEYLKNNPNKVLDKNWWQAEVKKRIIKRYASFTNG